jgi:probable O-glycosylation ligase (exosortase A-associated)
VDREMKQTLFMLLLFTFGTVGAFVKGPFCGIAVYYLFAVLRPQYLWKWALTLDVRWSFYVAIATFASLFVFERADKPANYSKSGTAFMLLFSIWVTLAYVFAIYPDASTEAYIDYLKIFAMFFCSVFIIREFSQVRTLYLIAVIALGYIAFEMNSLYFFDGRMDIYHEGYGGLDNNGAGLMIAMGAPMAYFLWQGSSQWWRWIFLALVPIIIHAVLMSYSRGAMISLLLSTPLLVLRSTNRKSMIVVIIGFVILVPFLAGQEIRDRFFSVQKYEEDGSARSRFGSWSAALQIAEDYPLFGAGIRNSNLLSYKYGADMEGRVIHSIYLQTAADCGFPALGLYLAIWFISWRTLRRFQKQYRNSTFDDYRLAYSIACGIEGAMVIFCVGAAFLSLEVFELPYLLILLALQLPGAVSSGQTLPNCSDTTIEFTNAFRSTN